MSNTHEHDTVLVQESVTSGGRATALMFMGALLGGLAIAGLFLGLNWYNYSSRLSAARGSLRELRQQIGKVRDENKAFTIWHERDAQYIEDLKAEITALRHGGKPQTLEPRTPYDAFPTPETSSSSGAARP